jgi:hypothetical protein
VVPENLVETYESCEVVAVSSKGVTQPNVILEVIHIKHESSNAVLQEKTTF